VKKFTGDARGAVKELVTVQIKWQKNAAGQFVPVEQAGTERTLPAQLVLLAMGFLGPEQSLLKELGTEVDARGNVRAEEGRFATSVKGASAVAISPVQSLVVWAINEGRGAARERDRFRWGAPSAVRLAALDRHPVRRARVAARWRRGTARYLRRYARGGAPRHPPAGILRAACVPPPPPAPARRRSVPVRPDTRRDGPSAAAATTGMPASSASGITRPIGSRRGGQTNRSKAGSNPWRRPETGSPASRRGARGAAARALRRGATRASGSAASAKARSSVPA
jgi:hypothetical protein